MLNMKREPINIKEIKIFRDDLLVNTYIADSPSSRALIARSRDLISLTINALGGCQYTRFIYKSIITLTKIHDMVPADGAVVHHNV
jgi:hypothetical protein